MKSLNQLKKAILILVAMILLLILFCSCDSKINRINIVGTYRNDSVMGYEAVVENGTITIYSLSPFRKEIYWYGTCNPMNNGDKDKIEVVSEKIDRGNNGLFGGFGSFGSFGNESGALEKTIVFYEDSLVFVYDMGGFNVREEKLYKLEDKTANDSNAEKLPETIPRETIPTPNDETKPSEDKNESDNIGGADYVL